MGGERAGTSRKRTTLTRTLRDGPLANIDARTLQLRLVREGVNAIEADRGGDLSFLARRRTRHGPKCHSSGCRSDHGLDLSQARDVWIWRHVLRTVIPVMIEESACRSGHARMTTYRRPGILLAVFGTLLTSLALAACGGGSSPGAAPTPTAPAANTARTISGSPSTSVVAGSPYRFTPAASDADGDALTFSVQNPPSWASFDPSTGTLTGTPPTAGTFSNITLSVSDGKTSSSLPAVPKLMIC